MAHQESGTSSRAYTCERNNPARKVRNLFQQGTILPIGQAHFGRSFQVVGKHTNLILGEILIEHVEVGFIIQAKRAIVKIRGSNRRPAFVHDHHLAVVHRGLELVDLDARLQQLPPA